MFTKKQIDEIAAKLADLAVKDSEFHIFKKPLNGSENVPLLQDGENRLMTLPDLINLLVGEEDRQYIKCILTVQCLTSNAVIKIKGESDFDYVTRSSYTAYYGEIVDVKISADGHDTWYDVVTMTQNHTIVVSLNEEGGGGGTPSVTQYYVRVTNSQGAKIELNGTQVASGSLNYFEAGDDITVVVSKDGYKTDSSHSITNIRNNWDIPITLSEEEEVDRNYVRFLDSQKEISRDGETISTKVLSNITWEITASDVGDPESEDPEDKKLVADIPSTLGVYVNDSIDMKDFMNGYTWIPKDQSKVNVDGDTITGTTPGVTEGSVYDQSGTYVGDSTVESISKDSSDIPVTKVVIKPDWVRLGIMSNSEYYLHATVYPSNATNKTLKWSTSDHTAVIPSTKGHITAQSVEQDKEAVITATASNGVKGTCDVTVKAQGTYVKKIMPQGTSSKPVEIPDRGGLQEFQLVIEKRGGYGSGYTEIFPSGGVLPPKAVEHTDTGFIEAFPVNWGNARTFTMWVKGNYTSDTGVSIVLKQKACEVTQCFHNDTSHTFPAAGGTYRIYFRCALSALTPSNVKKGNVTANVYTLSASGRDQVSKAKILTAKNPTSAAATWVSFANAGTFETAGTSVPYASYTKDGCVNGKFKNLDNTGAIGTYSVDIECSPNTGASRTAYVAFKTYKEVVHDGYVTYDDDWIYFTVNQQAGQ